MADVIRYLLATVPGCVIPITSPIYRQLEMLENYLKAQNHKFPGWNCVEGKLTAPNGNFARWFATDTPTAVESFHGKFLVRVLEEGKSMEPEIWDQTNRWQPKLTIIVSSKGLADGRFYEALTIHREHNRVHEIDATMCPWIPKKWIEQQIAQHGSKSALIKSMIYNEFSDIDTKNLITMDQIQRNLKFPAQYNGIKTVVAAIDVSAAKKGGDECVCYHRVGNFIKDPYILPYSQSEMEAVGFCVRWIREIRANYLYIDVGGLGGPVASRIAEVFDEDKSVKVIRINFGGKDMIFPNIYYDKAAEMYGEFAKSIEHCRFVLPSDRRTHVQLVSRAIKPRSDGRIQLVSKADMPKSPDRSDALVMCAQEPVSSIPMSSVYRASEGMVDRKAEGYQSPDGFDLGN